MKKFIASLVGGLCGLALLHLAGTAELSEAARAGYVAADLGLWGLSLLVIWKPGLLD